MPHPNSSAQPGAGLIILLAALATIGPLAVDTYLPSFHAMSKDLASPLEGIQQTLTLYMAAFAFMTLWHGALSDSFGRRRVILIGVLLFGLSSLAASLAQNLQQLIACRILQGFSAGAGIIVTRALIRDRFQGIAAQQLMSKVSMIFSFAPTIAPLIGGWLEILFGWRSVFYFLCAFSLVLWLACLRYLPETLPTERRQAFRPKNLLSGYRQILLHGRFLRISIAICLGFSGFFIYVLSAPTFLITHLHLRENQFYWLFVPATSGMIVGAWLSGRLASRPRLTLQIALVLMLIAAAGNCIVCFLTQPGVPQSIMFIPIYTVGMSLAMPTLTIYALDCFPERRGMSASCQGFIHLSSIAIFASLVAPRIWHSTALLSLFMLSSVLLCCLFIRKLVIGNTSA